MKRNTLILIASTFLLLTSCEVEFSPNADWKEIPVVYCLLDQQDDTTWARVEKCYLGEGDIYEYSSITDSINYPQGSIEVSILVYRNGSQVDSLPFRDTLVNRPEGNFAHLAQPLWYCPTQGRLQENCSYRIRVRRTADHSILAQSTETISLVIKQPDDSLIVKPYSSRRFAFKDGHGKCNIEWNPLVNARLYQPMVRFYYCVGADTLYTDIACQSVSSPTHAIAYDSSNFFSTLKQRLKDDPREKLYPAIVDIYILACTEDLNAYIYSITDAVDIDQAREMYTNIEGGLGVFAARRKHLYKRMLADDSQAPGGFYRHLKSLGVGF